MEGKVEEREGRRRVGEGRKRVGEEGWEGRRRGREGKEPMRGGSGPCTHLEGYGSLVSSVDNLCDMVSDVPSTAEQLWVCVQLV